MSKKHEIYLHKYLKKITSNQKKELCGLLRKKLAQDGRPNYIYQVSTGTNRPEADGMVCERIIEYSQSHKVDRCYVTIESIKAGYKALDDKKP